MPQLVGFIPSIQIELEFSGQELLYLVRAAQMHYDGDCQATAHVAGRDGRDRNGLLILITSYLDPECSWDSWAGGLTPYLAQHADKTTKRLLPLRDVDLLAKVAEMFTTGSGYLLHSSYLPYYDPEYGKAIYTSLQEALLGASQHLIQLRENEIQRRHSLKEQPC